MALVAAVLPALPGCTQAADRPIQLPPGKPSPLPVPSGDPKLSPAGSPQNRTIYTP